MYVYIVANLICPAQGIKKKQKQFLFERLLFSAVPSLAIPLTIKKFAYFFNLIKPNLKLFFSVYSAMHANWLLCACVMYVAV